MICSATYSNVCFSAVIKLLYSFVKINSFILQIGCDCSNIDKTRGDIPHSQQTISYNDEHETHDDTPDIQ